MTRKPRSPKITAEEKRRIFYLCLVENKWPEDAGEIVGHPKPVVQRILTDAGYYCRRVNDVELAELRRARAKHFIP